MQETTNTKEPLELGRLIHILSNKIKRRSDYYNISQDTDLTSVQQQILRFILLESKHAPVFQRDLEEAFQIRQLYYHWYHKTHRAKRLYYTNQC